MRTTNSAWRSLTSTLAELGEVLGIPAANLGSTVNVRNAVVDLAALCQARHN